MWKHCTWVSSAMWSKLRKSHEESTWRMGCCSLPKSRLKAKASTTTMTTRKGDKAWGGKKGFTWSHTRQSKRRCKGRHTKSTAPQPHQAKDKRKQDDACRISGGTQHCPAAMAQSQAIHQSGIQLPSLRESCPWFPSFDGNSWPAWRCKLNHINHQMIS